MRVIYLFRLFSWFFVLKGCCFGYIAILNIIRVCPGEVCCWLWSYFSIISLKLFSCLQKLKVGGIESEAIFYYFGNIGMKLSGCYVLTCFEVILYCWEVHRFFDYFYVLRDVESYGINWLSERPRGFAILEEVKYADAGFECLADVFEGISFYIFLSTVFLINRILYFLGISNSVIGFDWSTIVFGCDSSVSYTHLTLPTIYSV